MAIHHPTPPLGGGERPRLPSAQVGPVTQAIRAMRSANSADRTITAIRDGLDRHFAQAAKPAPQAGFSTQFTHGIRALSRTKVEDLIGDLIDLLDAIDGDADLEDGHDAEGNTDDNGLGDYDAHGEQGFRGYGGCL